jgi:hypothetical protein
MDQQQQRFAKYMERTNDIVQDYKTTEEMINANAKRTFYELQKAILEDGADGRVIDELRTKAMSQAEVLVDAKIKACQAMVKLNSEYPEFR